MSVWMAAFWAGLLSLDFIGLGPIMISQPMVCGPLLGILLDHAVVGLLIGAILQLLWMDLSAVGVGIPFDATAVTLLAVYWASLVPSPSLSQIVLAVVMAVPFGWVFRAIDQWARRYHTFLIHRIDNASDEVLSRTLTSGITIALGLLFLRYTLCYAVALSAGEWVLNKVAYIPRLTLVDQGLTMAALLLPVAGLGVCLELLLSDEPTKRWDILMVPFRGHKKKDI